MGFSVMEHGFTVNPAQALRLVRGLFFASLLLVLPGCSFPEKGLHVLFIGNSFTSETGAPFQGGIPRMLEVIAKSKGKAVTTSMLTEGGQGWAFHAGRPITDQVLKSTAWDYVVMQDLSWEPTRLGSPQEFQRSGEALYAKIAQDVPNAAIILYETWAYPVPRPYYTPARMLLEIQGNYAQLRKNLAAKDESRPVLMARVGTAFAASQNEHPEINLYASDNKHPSKEGAYLSACVFYTLLFDESPKGVTNQFSTLTIDPAVAAQLQTVAEEMYPIISPSPGK